MSVDIGASAAKSDPNVVPLCDILLVLLIIFMVITPVAQKGIDVKLPETADQSQAGSSSSTIILTLESDGNVKLNTEPIEMSLVEGRLRDLYATRQDKTIFIRADATTPYRKVLELIDKAKGAGIDVLGVIPERYTSAR